MKTAGGSTVTVAGTAVTVEPSRRDARRTKTSEPFTVSLTHISRVVLAPSSGGKFTSGWLWLLQPGGDQEPARPDSSSRLFFPYLGSDGADASAVADALADATAGRLTPVLVEANRLMTRIDYTTEPYASSREKSATASSRAGNRVAKEAFGTKMVTLYEGGYVTVATVLFGNKDAVPERLISIEASTELAKKKSGAGRTAAFVATGGLNLLTSNKKGDVYLTIVTNGNSHVLRSQASDTVIKVAKQLEATGNALIAAAQPPEQPQLTPTSPAQERPVERTVTERLAELGALLEAGHVSQHEYDELRQKVLDDI